MRFRVNLHLASASFLGYTLVQNAVARLGLADVHAFGLTLEDCTSLLKQLAYDVREVL